jgi:hypothetical protein
MDNAPDSTQDGKTHGVNILIGLALCVFMYIALFGPAVRLYNSPACPEPVKKGIVFLYSPLATLDQNIAGNPFSRYALLWGKH